MTFWIYATGVEASRKEERVDLEAMQNNSEVKQEVTRRMKQTKENWITDRCQ